MRQTTIIATTLALFLTATAASAHHTPSTVRIDAAAKKQAAVTFDHAKHVARAKTCDTCHHTNKGLTKADDKAVKKCTACHLDPKGTVPSMRDPSLQKNAFHVLCIKCHKDQKKGPVACTGCHKK